MKVLVLSIALFLSAESFGLSDSDSLNLSGVVAPTIGIDVLADNKATSLDIKNGETDALVAMVSETANVPYEVAVSSTSGGLQGQLTGGGGITSSLPYNLKYGSAAAVAIGTTDATVKTVSEVGGEVSASNEVRISFVGLGANASAGTYSDTLNFTIRAL